VIRVTDSKTVTGHDLSAYSSDFRSCVRMPTGLNPLMRPKSGLYSGVYLLSRPGSLRRAFPCEFPHLRNRFS
jgi:hypothetical protein